MSGRPPLEDGRSGGPELELSERIGSLSMETLAALSSGERARRLSGHRRTGSQLSLLSAGTEDHLLAGVASTDNVVSRASSLASLYSPSELEAADVRSPSWEEKGKTVAAPEDPNFRTPPRQVARGRPPSAAAAGATPASGEPGSSRGGSQASPAPDAARVAAALGSASPDAQMRALRKLRKDAQLCGHLAEQEGGAALLVGLVQPPKSWLPSFGGSDVQTTAAAAAACLARLPAGRRQLAAAGGAAALVGLLNTGGSEAQGHAAQALGSLAEDPALSFQVGQAGACAPLVRMLTSATPLHSSLLSLQVAAEDEGAQAHAAAALAVLAATSANREKIVEAGGIAPLVLLLSAEAPGLQAAAARCLHGLGQDRGAAAAIAEAGALQALLPLLGSEAPAAAAAAAAAVGVVASGVVASGERAAANATPKLAGLLASELAAVRTAAAGGLAALAHGSAANKARTAGEAGLLDTSAQALAAAEAQLRLAARLDSLAARPREGPLLALLDGALGRAGLGQLARLAGQLRLPLSEGTDAGALAAGLRQGALAEQLAVCRLLASLSADGFARSCMLGGGRRCLGPLARLLRSESAAVRGRAATALGNLASANPEAVRQTGCEAALAAAAGAGAEARVPALRCLYNLSEAEACLPGLAAGGCLPALLTCLARGSNPEAQQLAAEALANLAALPQMRQKAVLGGGVEPLVALLHAPDAQLAAAAAAALWQLCADEQGAAAVGAAPGAAAAAVAGLQQTPARGLLESAAGLVAGMARSPAAADALAAEGAIEHLLPLLRDPPGEAQALAADALRRFARAREEWRLQMAGASIPALLQLLASPLPDAQVCAAGCLAALAETGEVRDRIGQSGGVQPLVQLLKTGSSQAKVAAALALTRLSVGSTANLREFVRAGGVEPLRQLLASNSPTARAAAQGALSSLAGGQQPSPPQWPHSPQPAVIPVEQREPGAQAAARRKRLSWRSPSVVAHPSAPGSSLGEQHGGGRAWRE